MRCNNGLSWFPVEFNVFTADIMFTDASDNAAAAVVGRNWTIQVFDGEFAWIKSKPIAFKELYAVLLGISTFAIPLKGHQVLINIDNMAVHYCVNIRVSKDTNVMTILLQNLSKYLLLPAALPASNGTATCHVSLQLSLITIFCICVIYFY